MPEFDTNMTQVMWVKLPPLFFNLLIARDGCFCQALLEKIYVN